MHEGTELDARVAAAIDGLRAGLPHLRPLTRAEYGAWQPTLLLLGGAYALSGPAAVKLVGEQLAARSPALAALLAQPPQPAPTGAARPLFDPWHAARPSVPPGELPLGVSLLCGQRQVGTTMLALQWAVGAARRLELAGRVNPPAQARGRVLLLAGDTRQPRMAWRLRRLRVGPRTHLDVVYNWRLGVPDTWLALHESLFEHRVLVIDGLRRALADAKGPLGLLQVCDRLSRLHVLAMATRTAVLLVDNAVYPPERPRLLPPDGDLTLVEDPVGAGLAFADAHGQLECVWRLWRRPREPLGLLTSLDGAEAQIVRVPLVRPLPGKGSQGRRPRAQGRKVAA